MPTYSTLIPKTQPNSPCVFDSHDRPNLNTKTDIPPPNIKLTKRDGRSTHRSQSHVTTHTGLSTLTTHWHRTILSGHKAKFRGTPTTPAPQMGVNPPFQYLRDHQDLLLNDIYGQPYVTYIWVHMTCLANDMGVISFPVRHHKKYSHNRRALR